MQRSDLPAPREGFVITHFLVVSDQDRSRQWYVDVLGAEVVVERDPVMLKVANTWIILNAGGGPTEDKPEVTLATPQDPTTASAFMNIRVADIAAAYRDWSAAGAQWLTAPVEFSGETRGYVRDPDGHLIEVGQATGMLDLVDEDE
jgi:catechol 2,3-dioxygenase-like lactoylglutathione lyase family enzyme